MTPRRITIRVTKRTGLPGWWVMVGGLALQVSAQRWALRHARDWAHWHAEGGGRAEVVIHAADGRIRAKDTYPRSSDPRRSKG